MLKNLSIQAGRKALKIIREEGLNPDRIMVMAGAAGGPKWLVLNGLDKVLPDLLFKGRKKPLFMIGSSIGAWRFAAMSQKNPVLAVEKLEKSYIGQCYTGKPTPSEISGETLRIMNEYISDSDVHEILDHPFMRLSIMAVKSRGTIKYDNKFLQGSGLLGAVLLNFISRRLLGFFFKRALFYDKRDNPPFIGMKGFPIEKTVLTGSNFKQVLMASGSIPMIMKGVSGIEGPGKGVYRDGGVIDYNFDIPFTDDGGIVLYPHYNERIVPGWLDKKIPWRKPSLQNTDNVLMISPSGEFVKNLPMGKIPDRNDFMYFKGKDRERISCWNNVVDESRRLADEFAEIYQCGKIGEYAREFGFTKG